VEFGISTSVISGNVAGFYFAFVLGVFVPIFVGVRCGVFFFVGRFRSLS
jgi:hypothetical protein